MWQGFFSFKQHSFCNKGNKYKEKSVHFSEPKKKKEKIQMLLFMFNKRYMMYIMLSLIGDSDDLTISFNLPWSLFTESVTVKLTHYLLKIDVYI